MIAYISGTVLRVDEHALVIESHGIGYRVLVPQYVIGAAGVQESVSLWTSFVVREQSQELFGFETHDEYLLFEKLIGVSGVGPKSALAMFDTLPAEQLIQALTHRDAAALAQTPGIGKKTAEKIVLELADALEKISLDSKVHYTPQSDLMDALASLGYSQQQIRTVVNEVDTDQSFEDQFKQALQLLGSA